VGRYYFHLRDERGRLEDREGIELAGEDRVLAAAVKGARSLIGQDVADGHLDLSGCIEVMDVEGRLVLALHFSAAVKLESRK
jgi:hypothetical protein